MEIYFSENKFKFKTNKQQIIIVPKRIVKKSNQRNKIRRQIRAIMRDNKIGKYFIKYTEENILIFTEIQKKINDVLSHYKNKISTNL